MRSHCESLLVLNFVMLYTKKYAMSSRCSNCKSSMSLSMGNLYIKLSPFDGLRFERFERVAGFVI